MPVSFGKVGMEITGDNLEELLSYDDLFLDYFNTFLALPVFPQPLNYNRLTGIFEELEAPEIAASVHATLNLPATPAPYGATDDEREHMMQWARNERLPLFLRTKLFRDLKLQKLLLKPLRANSPHNSNIRGYSRQSQSFLSSLSSGSGQGSESGGDAESVEEEEEWTELRNEALMHTRMTIDSRRSRLQSEGESFISSEWQGQHSQMEGVGSVSRQMPAPPARQRTFPGSEDNSFPKQRTSPVQNTSILKSRSRQTTQGGDSGLGTDLTTTRDVTFHTRDPTLVSIDENALAETGHGVAAEGEDSNRLYKTSQQPKKVRIGDKRAISAPVNYDEFMKDPDDNTFNQAFGEEEIELGPDLVNYSGGQAAADTDAAIKNLEGRHKLSFQQMKELLLQSSHGMHLLKDFLLDTNGCHLIDFWLECERIKDASYISEGGIYVLQQRHRMFRELQDRYGLRLTTGAKKELMFAASSSSPAASEELLLKLQYDVLRRLRAYWLPRFLIHADHSAELRRELCRTSEEQVALQSITTMSTGQPNRRGSFLPSISLAHSMPVKPDNMMQLIRTQTWAGLSAPGVQSRVQSAKQRNASRIGSAPYFNSLYLRNNLKTAQRNIVDFLVIALSADRDAGGPLLTYLAREGEPKLLASLLLWQEIEDYGLEEQRSADRLLRLSHAWSIYNQYLSPTSNNNIGLPRADQERVLRALQSASGFVSVSVFDATRKFVIQQLEQPWVLFIKQDWKNFLDCESKKSSTVTPVPPSYDDIEVAIVQKRIVVRRPWVAKYPGSTTSERGRRLTTAMTTAENIDAERSNEKKARAAEERRAMQRERKKAIKAAYARVKEQKKQAYLQAKLRIIREKARKGGTGSESPVQQDDEGLPDNEKEEGLTKHAYSEFDDDNLPSAASLKEDEDAKQEKPPTFREMVKNKTVMLTFKRHVTEYEGKEALNKINMWVEIQTYLDLPDTKQTRGKKENITRDVFKLYIDAKGRRHIPLSDRVYERLTKEKNVPSPATLRLAQNNINDEVENIFTNFWKAQLEEFGDNKAVLQGLSQGEMSLKLEGDNSMLKGWNKKGRGGGKTGRAPPTKEDKQELLTALSNASQGHLPLRMLYFYKYIVQHGDEDGMPLIERDLLFYLEVAKFKIHATFEEGNHLFSNEEIMKSKVQAILDCYLESSTQPSLQIDVPSDIHQRMTRAAKRYIEGKEQVSTVFDEGQICVFKELLPYWAGFTRQWKEPEDPDKIPITKKQKELKKRLKAFVSMPDPDVRFKLPKIPPGSQVASFSFTLNDGIKYKDSLEQIAIEEELNMLQFPISRATTNTSAMALSREITRFSSGLARREATRTSMPTVPQR